MRFPIVLLLLIASGCASTTPRETAPAPDSRAVTILDGEGGSVVGWRDMVDVAASADVVIIGEMHGHELGLDVAASLWEDLLASDGLSPALSLEFFGRDMQGLIDDYLTGVIDEDAFRELANRSPGNYPPGHARMVNAAKDADVRVFAANAPRRYSTLARTGGLERLEELRVSQSGLYEVPEPMDVGDYRDRFFELFAGMMASHGGSEDPAEQEEQIEGFFRAQSVWDATMADTISRAAADGNAPVVHVVGQFHSDRDGGLVQRLRAQRPDASIVTISMIGSSGAALVDEDVGRADYVVMVGDGDTP